MVLCVPGNTTGSESWMLGFVFGSMFAFSAKNLCEASCQCQIKSKLVQLLKLYLEDAPVNARSGPLSPGSWPNRSSGHLSG